jgi:phospholipid/cholesterol/gamma-HCH transport system ATP-binding protein
MKTIIEIKGLHKSFSSHHILKGVNLKIPENKVTVILGGSGQGKSVLLKHMMGLLQADSGEVWVDGKNISDYSENQLVELRKKFGYLFQHAALFDSMTVFENVSFPLLEHGRLTRNEMIERVNVLLEQVGLSYSKEKFPAELSGGMQKRVGLARALALQPKILLYDEPTTGLDPLLTESIDNLIMDTQKNNNVSSVVISHDLHSAVKIADHVAMLHNGVIIYEGSMEGLQSSNDKYIKKFLQRLS